MNDRPNDEKGTLDLLIRTQGFGVDGGGTVRKIGWISEKLDTSKIITSMNWKHGKEYSLVGLIYATRFNFDRYDIHDHYDLSIYLIFRPKNIISYVGGIDYEHYQPDLPKLDMDEEDDFVRVSLEMKLPDGEVKQVLSCFRWSSVLTEKQGGALSKKYTLEKL